MGIVEIVLLLAGGIIAVLSFVLPAQKETLSDGTRKLAKEEIRKLVDRELEAIRSHVDDVVDESIEYAVEKTERSLERLTNEKIMAVNEYSDTVLEEIRRNHDETMFLYDMLNDKHTNLKNTVSEANKTVQEMTETRKEAEAVVSSFQQLVPEAVAREDKILGVPEAALEKPGEAEGMKTPAKGSGSGAAEDAQPSDANSNDKILELHRQGKSKVAIAKALGLGVGEVKLVIDLYKNM